MYQKHETKAKRTRIKRETRNFNAQYFVSVRKKEAERTKCPEMFGWQWLFICYLEGKNAATIEC